MIEVAAPMHDIGKIGIPDSILLKEGPLTAAETEVMRTHPRIGYDILKGSPSKYLSMGAIIALGHHEKFDGTGYPNGLHGEDIPVVARVVAVADVFDALVSRAAVQARVVADGRHRFPEGAARPPLRSEVHRRLRLRPLQGRDHPRRILRLTRPGRSPRGAAPGEALPARPGNAVRQRPSSQAATCGQSVSRWRERKNPKCPIAAPPASAGASARARHVTLT